MSAGHREASIKAILYAFLADFGLAIARTGAAIYTGSGSMMADAEHPPGYGKAFPVFYRT
ncbi:MAG: hypothetical protein MI673_00690 [Thiotrichales bacterium]|nr:hypothetical protein [Thiotrichales bacterium]